MKSQVTGQGVARQAEDLLCFLSGQQQGLGRLLGDFVEDDFGVMLLKRRHYEVTLSGRDAAAKDNDVAICRLPERFHDGIQPVASRKASRRMNARLPGHGQEHRPVGIADLPRGRRLARRNQFRPCGDDG